MSVALGPHTSPSDQPRSFKSFIQGLFQVHAKPPRKSEAPLIFDIGVNHGEDSEFYLAKGFRVVGIEANPILCAKLQERFENEIASGQYNLLNIGIWSEEKELEFYHNLDNDHWSSFDREYGCRNDTKFEILNIKCTTIDRLLSDFGTPHYMKIDVEGADRIILKQLQHVSARPNFISVEEYGFQAIVHLRELGYRFFYVAPQNDKSWAVPPNPAREGLYVERAFTGVDSGLFGAELPGSWMNFEEALRHFLTHVRAADGSFLTTGEWYDVHARISDPQLD